jgi:RNA polymerase sigma factor (sigma-70 family)
MTARPAHPRDDDATALFRRRHRDLERVVRANVNAPDAVIEDACAFAWMQLVRCHPDEATAYAWLKTVAIHRAWALARRERRDARLELFAQDAEVRHDPRDTELVVRAHEALEAVARLPERQRTYLTLFLNGNTYDDIARLTNTSRTAVNRHLARARTTLRQQRHA